MSDMSDKAFGGRPVVSYDHVSIDFEHLGGPAGSGNLVLRVSIGEITARMAPDVECIEANRKRVAELVDNVFAMAARAVTVGGSKDEEDGK